MSILISVTGRNNQKLIKALAEQLPDFDIFEWPSCQNNPKFNPTTIEFVLSWKSPDDLWQQLPNLKTVQSYGAGVDAIRLDVLPNTVSVCRIVDAKLADDMAEYVLGQILSYKLRIREYQDKQSHLIWKPRRALPINNIGILGLGELGQALAKRLNHNGFSVSGWARSQKQIEQVNYFAGEASLDAFLANVDVLVCLLPLTEQTQGIINKKVFCALPNHALLINVARGQHVNEQDLLSALEEEQIAFAILDVSEQEPLPPTHPFWQHSKIAITPHCAALTDLATAVEQIANNAKLTLAGETPRQVINRQLGY